MLSDPISHDRPFPFFQCAPALESEDCAALEHAFEMQADWQHREEVLYGCHLRDATAALPPALLRGVVARMREITRLPLLEKTQVTVQRMDPGQSIGVHTDEPLVGYELARLVAWFNADWRPEHGGVLELFESEQGLVVASVEPRYNTAVGFVMHERSFHGVEAVSRSRRSVVFNFWHAANSPDLGEAVAELFAGADFSELPSALDAMMAEAEATLPEEVSFRAGLTAWALHCWGYDTPTVAEGYRHSAGLAGGVALAREERAAVRLADWVAGLRESPFDLRRWESLREDLRGLEPHARALPIWALCVPRGA